MNAKKWFPFPELNVPCADISFAWSSAQGASLVVLMHFSRVLNGVDKDLEIVFPRPLALQWEDESFGLIPSPATLPKCSNAEFLIYTHPTLVIEDSPWAEAYASRKYSEGDPALKNVVHYFLVSMNELVHVLAEANPNARWVASADA
jgi:hypothetical protein